MKEFELNKCCYCKMWVEKWEHKQYHVAYCLEKSHRVAFDCSKTIDRSETKVTEIEDPLIYSKTNDPKDSLQLQIKDGRIKENTKAGHTNNDHIQKRYKCSEVFMKQITKLISKDISLRTETLNNFSVMFVE